MNPEPRGKRDNPSNRDIDTKKDDKQFSLLFMGKKVVVGVDLPSMATESSC